jgi:hypothetical protein
MPAPLPIRFHAGEHGEWRIDRVLKVIGDTLPLAPRLAMHEGPGDDAPAAWTLRGVTSNLRYTVERERQALLAVQAGLGRQQAGRAALIPIRKNAAWWDLAQDARRALLEEASRHVAIGMEYLPAVARRLIHCRDLGEPFDFLTWFEYAPEDEPAFDELLVRLRASAEWRHVEHEVDIRLERDA